MQNKFPINIKKLALQMTSVCNQNKEHCRLINNLAFGIELNNKDVSETCVSMNITNEVIPRKAEGNGKSSGRTSTDAGRAIHGRNADDAKRGVSILCKKYSRNFPNA